MNSVGDLSSGVGVLGNSHKFGYHFRMLFKTTLAIGCAVTWLSATAIAEDFYKFLNEIPIAGEGGWDTEDDRVPAAAVDHSVLLRVHTGYVYCLCAGVGDRGVAFAGIQCDSR